MLITVYQCNLIKPEKNRLNAILNYNFFLTKTVYGRIMLGQKRESYLFTGIMPTSVNEKSIN